LGTGARLVEIAARFGGLVAGQVMQDIYDALETELKWRRLEPDGRCLQIQK
jgi:hypothetical protein